MNHRPQSSDRRVAACRLHAHRQPGGRCADGEGHSRRSGSDDARPRCRTWQCNPPPTSALTKNRSSRFLGTLGRLTAEFFRLACREQKRSPILA